MPFGNPLVGGTTLIRPAIQSPNFVAGSAGWKIAKDGTAEFNNATFRGTVVVGVAPNPQVEIISSAGSGLIRFPTNRAIEAQKSTILSGPVNPGTAAEYAALAISGPSVTGATDQLRQQFNSQANDGSSDANIQWILMPSTLLMALDKTNGLQIFRDLSVRGNSTAAGHRYMDVNAPAGFDATSILLGLLANSGDRFRVLATGKTDITCTDTAVPGLSVNHATGQTGHLTDWDVNSVIKAYIDFDGSFVGAAGVFSSSVIAQNFDSGLASVTTVANQWVEVTVNFNQTFNGTPRVVLTGNNGAPAVGGSTILMYAANAVTTTGFTLRVLRGTAVTMNIAWFAHFV